MGKYYAEKSSPCEIIIDDDKAIRLLKSAINDYLAYLPDQRIHREAKEWLFTEFKENKDDKTEDAKNGFVSFFSVCELLEINYEKLRISIRCREDQGKKRLVDSQFDEIFKTCREAYNQGID